MEYKIIFKRKVIKQLKKLPQKAKDKFEALLLDLKEQGPIQNDWSNYSKLGKNEHHCHLSYSWIACWTHQKETIIIEVYYVGSRENAPY